MPNAADTLDDFFRGRPYEPAITLAALGLLLAVDLHLEYPTRWGRPGPVLRWVGYGALLLAIVFFGVFSSTQFIYFQF